MFPHKPPLTIAQILAWADDHRQRAEKFPHAASGSVLAHPAETWGGINQALTVGLRGLPGGDSLAGLLRRERSHQDRCGRSPEKYTEQTRLLNGPYRAPSVRVGGKVVCLIKGEVVVTSWIDGLVSWPRCRPLNVPRGHPSLLVNEELARAIRSEAASSVMHWWGVSEGVVWRWRKALGVDKRNNPGSNRLVRAAAEEGASAVAEKEWTAEEREARRQRAVEGVYVGRLPTCAATRPWWPAASNTPSSWRLPIDASSPWC